MDLIKSDVYMKYVDLKGSFHSMPIRMDHQKYVTLFFESFFQFTCMPNGYGNEEIHKNIKVPFSRKKISLCVSCFCRWLKPISGDLLDMPPGCSWYH